MININNMKKIKIILIIVFLTCVAAVIYWKIYDATFVKSNLIKYTNIKDFIFEADYYDNSQSFIKVIITDQDRNALLKKHNFETSLEKLKGRVKCPYIQYNNTNYVYFVDDNNGRQYGYILYCLNAKDNTFILYEYFGD